MSDDFSSVLATIRKLHAIEGEPRVPLGRTVITPTAQVACTARRVFLCLAHHEVGSWGVLDEYDTAKNEAALRDGSRLMSVYPIDEEKTCDSSNSLWIISEDIPEGRVTTVLLPSDY